MEGKMVCVISFGVLLWFFAAVVADEKDVLTLNIDKRGITADEVNKRKSQGRSDQDVKDSGKKDYYYLPSSISSYGRPHFSSSGYDSTGPSGPSYDSTYPSNDYPHQHYSYRPSSYDQGLTPHHYPPTAEHHTTTIAKPINTFALKSILIPIAGLAILGAAAALSSNPVLLQLGVVKGRRRRSLAEGKQFLEKLYGKRF